MLRRIVTIAGGIGLGAVGIYLSTKLHHPLGIVVAIIGGLLVLRGIFKKEF